MTSDIWGRRLSEFKQQERPETVLMVSGNPAMTRIVVAWSGMVSTRAKRLTQCPCADENAVWRWLWENATYSKEELWSRIPGSQEIAEQQFNALVANRVLYPDGTANSFVEKYLREKVLTLFGVHGARKRRSVV